MITMGMPVVRRNFASQIREGATFETAATFSIALVFATFGFPGKSNSDTAQPDGGKPASLAQKLSDAAIDRTRHQVRYDPAYVAIAYPMGDVPADTGVCSDVIIRSYRQLNIDLQKRMHEDMRKNFSGYPKKWGLRRPDKNIDHRRVPNLQTFFSRHGQSLKISQNPKDYRPGDVVSWNLVSAGILDHIGIVSQKRTADGVRPLIVHNIGRGPQLEDILFIYKITGHYRYLPNSSN